MNEIAVTILEKDEAIALVLVRRSGEDDALVLQIAQCRVKVSYRNRNVPQPWSSRTGLRPGPFRRDNLDQPAVLRTYKIIALIVKTVPELERVDIPFRESSGVWRRDREVLNAGEHKKRVYQAASSSIWRLECPQWDKPLHRNYIC